VASVHAGPLTEAFTMDREPPATVAIRDVCKTFTVDGKPVVALDHVSVNVRDGEFLAIIGPSGCGKSTLVRMVAGLEQPTSGEVSIAGERPAVLSARQHIGFAMQDHALLPWLTVRSNVALPFRVAGRAVDWAAVDALVALVGLTEFAAARPRQLSGGMRQRASIARALALEPSLLLLDEPFGALDAVTRRHLNLELQSLWSARRLTTLLVTHSVEEAVLLADRVLVLSSHPGRLRLLRDVPFARPRGAETRRLPEFRELVDELTECLDVEARKVRDVIQA
jgi:NitT/TauT family transport system ATP-binding protein